MRLKGRVDELVLNNKNTAPACLDMNKTLLRVKRLLLEPVLRRSLFRTMQQVVICAFKMHKQPVAWSEGQQLVLFIRSVFWEGENDSDRTRHFFFNSEWKANSICLILCVYFSLFF